MGLYSKFIVNDDCQAYYFDDGVLKRLGGDENNNVDHPLTEAEVMEKRQSLGIPFANLKTETEVMLMLSVHLPE